MTQDSLPILAPGADLRTAFANVFGDTYEAEGRDVVKLDWVQSPVGPLLAGATEDALVLLEFSERKILEEQLETVRRRLGVPIVPGDNVMLGQLRIQLAEYFSQRRRDFDLPLKYPGTAFQEKVWSTLLTIPYGQTWSYLELARTIGDTKATRAVGTANGMNRIAIVIPCHRVINANGELGGYGGGLWRKRILLDLEQGQGKLI
ncbi:O-6-methylguanine DNA methyltransferase [Povalibacter uvarum]|uniref:Methylated-DNA--protein-cysteine methyltransferase n=1 Tax=Povalibacter uvarum TaxID=732238 RepID=A0A841HUV1_9GAMM|nr:methylated-DNA--[protein]-cysteine S-methyltransferase [Povalibacter uvarum]MBB6095605.1 O-6-methylguanine DNA methyltransferase [Povalibacter uvarum]